MAKRNIRQLKLHSKCQALQHNTKQVPWLNVSDVWLAKVGFKAGDRVEITVKNNWLIIKNCASDRHYCH